MPPQKRRLRRFAQTPRAPLFVIVCVIRRTRIIRCIDGRIRGLSANRREIYQVVAKDAMCEGNRVPGIRVDMQVVARVGKCFPDMRVVTRTGVVARYNDAVWLEDLRRRRLRAF